MRRPALPSSYACAGPGARWASAGKEGVSLVSGSVDGVLGWLPALSDSAATETPSSHCPTPPPRPWAQCVKRGGRHRRLDVSGEVHGLLQEEKEGLA